MIDDNKAITRDYILSRNLPEEIVTFWMDIVTRIVPAGSISLILDLGCGTGRFSLALHQCYKATVVGVDPSHALIKAARASVRSGGVTFKIGTAESIPLSVSCCDLVFLSMTYHHINNKKAAIQEFKRILRDNKYVCMITSTVEQLGHYLYLKYFPSAKKLNTDMVPSRSSLVEFFKENGFSMLAYKEVRQLCAKNHAEYLSTIQERTFSDLKRITDQEFNNGIESMRREEQKDDERTIDTPIYEPVDLYVFRLN